MFKHWCYQFIALKELRSGLFHDAALNRVVAQHHSEPHAQLLERARALTAQQNADSQFTEVRRMLQSTVGVLWAITGLLGLSVGLAALGSPSQPVNVIWSLLGLLLVPTVTLVFWLLSLALPTSGLPWFGKLLQSVMTKWLGKTRLVDAWHAWIELARQVRALPLWLALVSHVIWCGLLLGSLLAMAAAFSLRHYTFVWETTWLPVDVFVQMASGIGSLSAWLGLPMPIASDIAASGNQALDDPQVRMRWANWLIGSILMIGLVPRLVAILVCAGLLGRRYRAYRIPTETSYASAVLAQIRHDCPVDLHDGAPGAQDQWIDLQPATGSTWHDQPFVVVGLDLTALPEWAQTLPGPGVVDDRHSRHEVLQQLNAMPPQRLLVIVDAGQTPDRGTLSVARELSAKAVQARLYLQPRVTGPDRSEQWRLKLNEVQLKPPFSAHAQALQWLHEGAV